MILRENAWRQLIDLPSCDCLSSLASRRIISSPRSVSIEDLQHTAVTAPTADHIRPAAPSLTGESNSTVLHKALDSLWWPRASPGVRDVSREPAEGVAPNPARPSPVRALQRTSPRRGVSLHLCLQPRRCQGRSAAGCAPRRSVGVRELGAANLRRENPCNTPHERPYLRLQTRARRAPAHHPPLRRGPLNEPVPAGRRS